MDRRTTTGTLLTTLVAGGVSAMIAGVQDADSKFFDILMYGGIAAIAVGVIGLILILIVQPKPKNKIEGSGSTSFRLRGGGQFDLEDFHSSADTLIDAEDLKRITVKRGEHAPTKSEEIVHTDDRKLCRKLRRIRDFRSRRRD